MSLKVALTVAITQMDETPLLQIVKVDTSVNPNPSDQLAEILLASKTAERMLAETRAEVIERMREFNVAIERFIEAEDSK